MKLPFLGFSAVDQERALMYWYTGDWRVGGGRYLAAPCGLYDQNVGTCLTAQTCD